MHRFYLPPEEADGATFHLSEADAHHALQVLRLRRGDRVVVLNGAGTEFLCELGEPQRRSVQVRVLQKQWTPPLPYRITLIQAVTKGKTMDWIVQKATELGVHRVAPILSERTVAQLDSESASSKVEKWRATAIESIKQCGSPWLPEIDAPISPQSFLARGDAFELMLIASLQPNARHPREYLQRFASEHGRMPADAAVWVGPEGDYTPAEVQAVLSRGGLPISLGRLVLRSETAALYALSILNYELSFG